MEKIIKLNLENGRIFALDIRNIVSFWLINANPLAAIKTCIIDQLGDRIHVRQTPAMIVLMMNHIASFD